MNEIEEQLSDQIVRHPKWWGPRSKMFGPDLSSWRDIGEILGMAHEPGHFLRFGSSFAGGWMLWSRAPGQPDGERRVSHGATPGEAVARALLALWGAE